ncbi:MAG: zinc ribbon domain-containing protein [Clostridia bacterium]|nr:zinc ribbon domain-containing protein [Clostridia bacterium]
MADLNNITNTADTTAEFDQNDIQQNKLMAVLAYLGILVLVPILAAKESKYARYHANQGLVLFIANIVVSVVMGIVGFIVGFIAGFTGLTFLATLVTIISWLLSAVIFVLAILGIVNAATGKAKELPVIGKFKLLK